MRTEYLKELELLPVWQLRKPLAGAPEGVQHDAQTETVAAQEPSATETAIAPAAPDSPNVVIYASEDAELQLMHAAEGLSQEAQQLSRNIARSMQLKAHPNAALALALQQSASVLLILGESLARAVLSKEDGLQALRGQVHSIDSKQVVVTDGLQAMLGQPEIKARVWKDCCLAMSLLSEKED